MNKQIIFKLIETFFSLFSFINLQGSNSITKEIATKLPTLTNIFERTFLKEIFERTRKFPKGFYVHYHTTDFNIPVKRLRLIHFKRGSSLTMNLFPIYVETTNKFTGTPYKINATYINIIIEKILLNIERESGKLTIILQNSFTHLIRYPSYHFLHNLHSLPTLADVGLHFWSNE